MEPEEVHLAQLIFGHQHCRDLKKVLDETLGLFQWYFVSCHQNQCLLIEDSYQQPVSELSVPSESELLDLWQTFSQTEHDTAVQSIQQNRLVGFFNIGAEGACICQLGVLLVGVTDSLREIFEVMLPLIKKNFEVLLHLLTKDDALGVFERVWTHLLSALDRDSMARQVLDEILKALQTSVGVLFLGDEEGHLSPQLTQGLPAGAELIKIAPISLRGYSGKASNWNQTITTLPPEDPLAKWLKAATSDEKGEVLAIPLWRSNEFIGVAAGLVEAGWCRKHNVPPALKTLSVASGLGIANARTFEVMRQKTRALSTVHTVHRLISSTLEIGELLPKLAHLITQVLGATKCSIMLVSKDGKQLTPGAAVGLEENEIGTQPLAVGKELPGWVAEQYQTVLVRNIEEDVRFSPVSSDVYRDKSYLCLPLIEGGIIGVITVSGRHTPPGYFQSSDREILTTLGEQAVVALTNAQMFEHQQQLTLDTISTLANLMETHDPHLEGHTLRVADLAEKIAARCGWDDSRQWVLRAATLLHDAGMLAVAAEEQRLTSGADPDVELDGDRHLRLSTYLAEKMGLPSEVNSIIWHHHENWDGSGLPSHLKGDEIPLGSRIVAVADAFIYLLKGNGDRSPKTPQEALAILRRKAGIRLDPRLVEYLAEMIESNSVALCF